MLLGLPSMQSGLDRAAELGVPVHARARQRREARRRAPWPRTTIDRNGPKVRHKDGSRRRARKGPGAALARSERRGGGADRRASACTRSGPLIGGRLLALMRDGLTLSRDRSLDERHACCRTSSSAAGAGAARRRAAAGRCCWRPRCSRRSRSAAGTSAAEALAPNFSRLESASPASVACSRCAALIELGKALARFLAGGAGRGGGVLRKQFRSFAALERRARPRSAIGHALRLIGAGADRPRRRAGRHRRDRRAAGAVAVPRARCA